VSSPVRRECGLAAPVPRLVTPEDGVDATEIAKRLRREDGYSQFRRTHRKAALKQPPRGLTVTRRKVLLRPLTAILQSEKLLVSLRRGADLRSFPEGIS
jgi:hypothetical protein